MVIQINGPYFVICFKLFFLKIGSQYFDVLKFLEFECNGIVCVLYIFEGMKVLLCTHIIT